MSPIVETSTPPNTPTPIGPYNHIAKVGSFITIGGTAGVNPTTGQLAGVDVASQTKQILDSFKVMLESANSDLNLIVHINIFLVSGIGWGRWQVRSRIWQKRECQDVRTATNQITQPAQP